MVYGMQQKQEIETIKERTFTVKLSDADCQRLAEKAAEVGETIDTLMEGFIGDLVNGTYTHGSDEVDCAEAWFERSYSFISEKTFLNYLVQYGDVYEVIDNLSGIEVMKEDIEIAKKELDTGILDCGGTWEDLEIHSSGVIKSAYSSKEEWENEQKEYIEQTKEHIENCESIIKEYWEEYLKFFKVPDADRDKEINNVKEWSKQLENFKGTNTNVYEAAIEEAIELAELGEPEAAIEM